MFGSEVLEVGIGIAFVYLLLSLMCTILNEWVAGFMAMRSQNLEAGIRHLLSDPDGTGLAKEFYEHPLIKGLSKPGKRPSYVPSHLFALALLDLVAPVDRAAGPKAFTRARQTVAALPDVQLQKVLLTCLDEAGNDLKVARENVERWFNDAMDRVSGWYKRKTQLIVLGLALLVTLAVNADTIMIANSLSRDSVLRAAVIAAAQETAKQPPPEIPGPAAGEGVTAPRTTESKAPLTRITQLREELQQLQLPIGWSWGKGDSRRVPDPNDIQGWFMKVLGLLFTTVAVSLGAPFWFDMLNKLINIRAAGKPPAEPSKA